MFHIGDGIIWRRPPVDPEGISGNANSKTGSWWSAREPVQFWLRSSDGNHHVQINTPRNEQVDFYFVFAVCRKTERGLVGFRRAKGGGTNGGERVVKWLIYAFWYSARAKRQGSSPSKKLIFAVYVSRFFPKMGTSTWNFRRRQAEFYAIINKGK